MGSKPVRERHHMLYGSTMEPARREWSSLSPEERAQIQESQNRSVERLSQPKVRGDEMTKSTNFQRSERGRPANQPMENLFGRLEWVYAHMTLTQQNCQKDRSKEWDKPDPDAPTQEIRSFKYFRKAAHDIDTRLREHGVMPTDHLRRAEREKIQSAQTHGLLFDIVTTRRVIMSGIPHKIATELYRWIAERYHQIKFSFIGITDNGAQRVARDVFCKDKITENAADEVFSKYITKADFTAIDGDHMYIVFPENDELIKSVIVDGIKRQKDEERERRMRYFTAKFTPDPEPEFLRKSLAEKREAAAKEKAERKERFQRLQDQSLASSTNKVSTMSGTLQPKRQNPESDSLQALLQTASQVVSEKSFAPKKPIRPPNERNERGPRGPERGPGAPPKLAAGGPRRAAPTQTRADRAALPRPLPSVQGAGGSRAARAKRMQQLKAAKQPQRGGRERAVKKPEPELTPQEMEMNAMLANAEARVQEVNSIFKKRLKTQQFQPERAAPLPALSDPTPIPNHEVFSALVSQINSR